MTDKEQGYWKTIVPPPHQHVFPTTTEVGVGSIWVCTCKTEFVYTGQVDGLFEPVPK